MVDISKIQVGDEVTIRAVVTEIAKAIGRVRATTDDSAHWFVEERDVVTHTPKPREIKVGDEVEYEHRWGVVRHIDGDFVWVRAPAEQRGVLKFKAELTHKS